MLLTRETLGRTWDDVTVPWGRILRAVPGPGLRQAHPHAHFKEDLLPCCRMRSAGGPKALTAGGCLCYRVIEFKVPPFLGQASASD